MKKLSLMSLSYRDTLQSGKMSLMDFLDKARDLRVDAVDEKYLGFGHVILLRSMLLRQKAGHPKARPTLLHATTLVGRRRRTQRARAACPRPC